MLGQLGTDTKPAQGKINLNYTNAIVNYDRSVNVPFGVPSSIAIAANAETNFVPWQPQDFFAVAANQMLKAYTTEWFEASPSNYMQTYYGFYGNNITAPVSGFISYTNLDGLNVTNIQYLGQTNQIPSFGVTNIPVFMNGSFVYSPAVNRILQLAANIYDATTNTSSLALGNSNYPSVFLPIFWKTNELNSFLNERFSNVYIRGYQYVQEPLQPGNTYANAVLSPPSELSDLPFGYSVSNVWGVPMIIGAKKGLPNFNGFELVSTLFVERELQFNRNDNTPSQISYFPFGRTYTTNQQYVIGISNAFAMDDWNSYGNPYNNQVTIYAQDQLGLGLTNSDNFSLVNPFFDSANLTLRPWTGQLYAMPFGSNVTVMQNLSFPPSPVSSNNLYTYYKTPTAKAYNGVTFTGPCFIPNSEDPDNYLDLGTPPLPQFGMMETNHLQAYMLDTSKSGNVYILDYVQLGSMNNNVDVNAVIADSDDGGLWSTNAYTGGVTPWGVVNQFNTCSQGGTVPGEDQDGGGAGGKWTTTPVPGAGQDTSPAAQQAFFAAFFSAGDTAQYGGLYVTNMLPIRRRLSRLCAK